MKHRRPPSERNEPTEASSRTDEPVSDEDTSLGHGPHHDPSVHAEREPFAVMTQRCRGEYP